MFQGPPDGVCSKNVRRQYFAFAFRSGDAGCVGLAFRPSLLQQLWPRHVDPTDADRVLHIKIFCNFDLTVLTVFSGNPLEIDEILSHIVAIHCQEW